MCAAILLSVPAAAHAGSIRNPAERHAAKACDHGQLDGCILRASLHYRVPFSLLKGIAFCESRLQRYAHNPSGASSYMQFMPGTWAVTPYGQRSIWSPKWHFLAGAWLLSHHGTGPWAASRRCWG